MPQALPPSTVDFTEEKPGRSPLFSGGKSVASSAKVLVRLADALDVQQSTGDRAQFDKILKENTRNTSERSALAVAAAKVADEESFADRSAAAKDSVERLQRKWTEEYAKGNALSQGTRDILADKEKGKGTPSVDAFIEREEAKAVKGLSKESAGRALDALTGDGKPRGERAGVAPKKKKTSKKKKRGRGEGR